MKIEGKTCLILYNATNGEPPEEEAATGDESLLDDRVDTRSVRSSLKELGVNVKMFPFRRLTSRVLAQFEEIKPDFVFNLCQGLYNHKHKALTEMYVAGLLELLKVPYTGSSSVSLMLGLNKARSKEILRTAGLPVAPSVTVPVGAILNFEHITPPFIVKPTQEDGSWGITKDSVVKTLKGAEERVAFMHEKYKQSALVEEFIDGREFTVTMFDNPERTISIGEVDLSSLPAHEPRIYSYDVKWNKRWTAVNARFPADIETGLKNRIEKISLKTFDLFGCRDYARIDFRVSENRRAYLIEVNPNPDISPNDEFGSMTKAMGITYTDFIRHIAENTLLRGTRLDFE